MFRKTRRLANGLLRSSLPAGLNKALFNKYYQVDLDEVQRARQYIAGYWKNLQRFHPKDDDNLLGLPYPYLVPAHEKGHEFDFNELYYWDSYFMVQGILNEENKQLVVGILEDLVSLFKRFKIVPNASRTYLTGRSQPPFLTSFIFDVYDAYDLSNEWLKSMIEVAEAEYHTVWMGTSKPNARQVYQGLSRYYDINYLHDLAEAESGWDMTTRFNRKCLDYLPIDLNSLLFKYEMDFARYYTIMNNHKVAGEWEMVANKRKAVINKLMWSNLRGIYFDYNFNKMKRGSIPSLATYYPMWAGMVDYVQAKQLVKGLRRFEKTGGLSTTESQQLNQYVPGTLPTQWAFPNGWAPLHFVTIKALQRYGYQEDARRVAMKWIKTNLDWFNEHGVFIEKYNVVQPTKPPVKGLYPSQTGFGWTNAVFEVLCQEFISKEVG